MDIFNNPNPKAKANLKPIHKHRAGFEPGSPAQQSADDTSAPPRHEFYSQQHCYLSDMLAVLNQHCELSSQL